MTDHVFDALDDYAERARVAFDVEIPVCRCGQELKISDYIHGECEACRARLRLPCVEQVSQRLRRRYRRPS
jgi:hypothetical protein